MSGRKRDGDGSGSVFSWRLVSLPGRVAATVLTIACALAPSAGCGPQAADRPDPDAVRIVPAVGGSGPKNESARAADAAAPARSRLSAAASEASPGRQPDDPLAAAERPADATDQSPDSPPRRSLADLLDAGSATVAAASPPLRDPQTLRFAIDDGRVAVAGIRKMQSRHLTLYTDLPQQAAVDELPGVFDLAVPEWCRYFELDPPRVADWHVTGFLIRDKPRFQAAGLIPHGLPPYRNGFQQGPYMWVNDQLEDYYRRHLLLHEGTHAFMNLLLGDLGPPWYAEGTAELLGTHRWQDGRLELGYMPRDKDETLGWGRIKIIKDDLAEGRGMMPQGIMDYGPKAHLDNSPYGWCWALAAFLDGHPAYQQRFRELPAKVRARDFTRSFQQQLTAEWSDLNEQWQVFVMEIDYGYDLRRAAIERQPARPLPAGGAAVVVDAARGWQSSGYRLEAETAYRISASGRFQVGRTSDVWWCEPGGVTLRYHRGRPLGLLLAAVRDDSQPLAGLSPLVKPQAVGLKRRWVEPGGGTLYLKINESAADLHDNRGEITVHIQPDAPGPPQA